MSGEQAQARRTRGRPPGSDGAATAQRLVEAASAVCAERGFDGTTLALVAKRAGVHATAIYNHFASRDELLYAAAVDALERITAVAVQPSGDLRTFEAITAAYLQPSVAQHRRVIAEIHLASARHPRLAELLAEWHQLWTATLLPRLPPEDPNPKATVKVLYLLLLGLCHLDDLPAVRAPRTALAVRAEAMVQAIIALS